jgi:hypothetical protein
MPETAKGASSMNRTDRAADALASLLMVGMGGLAGAASFTHVHDLAAHHGQTGWLAWAVAVSIELMAIVAALEIRRAKRVGTSVRMPFAVLVGGFALSLAANVAEAESSPWGWITAATPAGAFLIVAKLAMRRLDHPAPAAAPAAAGRPVTEAPTARVRLDPEPAPELTEPAPAALTAPTPPATTTPAAGAPAPALVEHARRLADEHRTATGTPISPDELRTRLRVPAPLAHTLHAAITERR